MRKELKSEVDRRVAAEELSQEHSNGIHHQSTIIEEHQQMLIGLRGEFKAASASLSEMKRSYEEIFAEKEKLNNVVEDLRSKIRAEEMQKVTADANASSLSEKLATVQAKCVALSDKLLACEVECGSMKEKAAKLEKKMLPLER